MRSFTPTRRSASHTQACDAAITVTPNSCSSASMASITGQCGDLAAVAFGVGGQSRVLMGAVRVCHHDLLATEYLRGLRLRGDARGDLDAELRRERPQHGLRVLIAAGEVDRD